MGAASDQDAVPSNEQQSPLHNILWFSVKTLAAIALLYHAFGGDGTIMSADNASTMSRRLTAVGDSIPFYMTALMDDLKARKKLFEDTPPEEVKYWFEYTGPLQVSFMKDEGVCVRESPRFVPPRTGRCLVKSSIVQPSSHSHPKRAEDIFL
jgi:hypothetical protein